MPQIKNLFYHRLFINIEFSLRIKIAVFLEIFGRPTYYAKPSVSILFCLVLFTRVSFD